MDDSKNFDYIRRREINGAITRLNHVCTFVSRDTFIVKQTFKKKIATSLIEHVKKEFFSEIICATVAFAATFFVVNTDQQLLRTKQEHLRTFFNSSRYQPQIYFGFGEQLDTVRTVAFVVILGK